VDDTNPFHEIWKEHAKPDARIRCFEPTAQRMQPGSLRYTFWTASRDCGTVHELDECYAEHGT